MVLGFVLEREAEELGRCQGWGDGIGWRIDCRDTGNYIAGASGVFIGNSNSKLQQ
jgi:hypothetical protein